jgi:hypothetical protein
MASGSGLTSTPLEGAMTDVGLDGDGSFQRGKDPKIDSGDNLGAGIVGSPMTESGSGLPSAGDPIMGVDSGLSETPNSMSGMPAGIEGESLGDGDPGPGGHVELPDLGAAAGSGRTIPGRELENFGRK